MVHGAERALPQHVVDLELLLLQPHFSTDPKAALTTEMVPKGETPEKVT